MRVVLQRVSHAKVVVDEAVTGSIDNGFLLLVGFEEEDTVDDLAYCARKVIGMRVFSDSEGKMNLSVKEVQGQILSVSQFTLHASTKKGNRPSFIRAAHPDKAKLLYKDFNEVLRQEGLEVKEGVFGAHMEVSLLNDGPVTIIIDSKQKEF